MKVKLCIAALLFVGTAAAQSLLTRFSLGEDGSMVIIQAEYYAQPESKVQRAVNDAILHDLAEGFIDPENVPEVLNDDAFRMRAVNFEQAQQAYAAEDWMGSDWALELYYDVEERKQVSQVFIREWSYSGGAHGNGYFQAAVFDRTSGALLSPEDFFTDLSALNAICGEEFRKLREIAPDQSLSDAGFEFPDDLFAINGNFYFTDTGFVVYFNSYEIASYADGPTELVVNLEDIRHLLKRGF